MERAHRERQLDAESELQLEVERHLRGEGIQRSWHRQLRMVSPDLRRLAPDAAAAICPCPGRLLILGQWSNTQFAATTRSPITAWRGSIFVDRPRKTNRTLFCGRSMA